MKSPLEMDYEELNALLDSYLKKLHFPASVNYQSEAIHYQRNQRLRLLIKAVYKLIKTELFYREHVRDEVHRLRQTCDKYLALKNSGCLKSLRTYLYLCSIGLHDLAIHLGGCFRRQRIVDFCIATMLYDAAFDLPTCRTYLEPFDRFIMNRQHINSEDPYLMMFQTCVDKLATSLGQESFDEFMSYVQVEHICQLMSITQRADEAPLKEDLQKITYAKGGISALAIMYLLAPQMNKQQQIAIYELGAVMQLIDDISDTKEDLEIGIRTLPNQKLLSFNELTLLYNGVVNNLITQCNINPEQPNATLDMLCWFADIILQRRYKKFFDIEKGSLFKCISKYF